MKKREAKTGPPAGGQLKEGRIAVFYDDRIVPAVRNLRPKLKDLERKLRASGVCHYSWEDLEQETLLRIWNSLKTDPTKIDAIRDPSAYAGRVAFRRAQEIRRGPGLQRIRHHVNVAFLARNDRLARWGDETSLIGGLREWDCQPAADISDFWQPVIEKFNGLKFWKGNKLRGDVIENAIFQLFGCTGCPVRLSQIALILASHCETLDPLWIPAAETPEPDGGVIPFPRDMGDSEPDPAVQRGEIRMVLKYIRALPLKQRLVFLKDLDWEHLSVGGFVPKETLAELLELDVDDFLPWLYKWTQADAAEREKMFEVGKHPEKILWKARKKIEKMLRNLAPVAILFCPLPFLYWIASV